MSLEISIGLEIHVQLATRTKMFCGDIAAFGGPPNTRVCPVCLGLPGALPVVNARAVRLAVRAALGLGCTVHETSVFVRKNYFYPDLPKGYQITQLERPLATGGGLAAGGGSEPAPLVRIRRIHLEEDAGKSLHDRLPGRSAVDLNRAGVPLMEIVTEPDLRSPAEARSFLNRLKRTLEYLAVSDCDMEKGSLRVDANLSVREPGAGRPGTPTEVKNLNSFAHLERALRQEAERQSAVRAAGGEVAAETLLWDDAAGVLRRSRARTGHHDYRYFPDPDLPPLVVPGALLDAERASLPELPEARAERLRAEYGLPAYDADVLTANRGLADYFEAVAESAGDAKAASNWVMTEVLAWLNRDGSGIEAYPVPPAGLGELLRRVAAGDVTGRVARDVLARMAETGRGAGEIIEAEGLARVADDARLADWVDAALRSHPEESDRLRAGEERLRSFFIGQVMRASGGRADPRRVADLLAERMG